MTRAIDKRLGDLERQQARSSGPICAVVVRTPDKAQGDVDREVAEVRAKLKAQGRSGRVIIIDEDPGIR